MNKKLPTPIKDLLNFSYENQIIGVHLALKNGYTTKDIALYVLNSAAGWERKTENIARGLEVISYKKEFLDRFIKLKISLRTEEPFGTEIQIRIDPQHRGCIVTQHRNLRPTYYNNAALILRCLVQWIEVFA